MNDLCARLAADTVSILATTLLEREDRVFAPDTTVGGGLTFVEAMGLAAELEQMTAVGEAVEQGRDQASIVVEDDGLVGKLEVGGDGECAPGVAMGEQDEE